MGAIEDIHADLDADVSEEKFREAVEAKVEQMGGLADEETAAMLIAHELDEGEIEGIADIEPGMEEVKFLGKVTRIGEHRTFERDDDSEGQVLNVTVADETGSVRIALWDEAAEAAGTDLQSGQVLRIKGRPKEGYNGLEVSVDTVEPDADAEIDVPDEEDTIDALALGRSDVTVQGVVLDTGTVRTFERDDGSEGRVANLTLGDETGRIRVTLWGEQADRAEELATRDIVEVVNGYVRERNDDLELHVGSRGVIEEVDADVEYVPDATLIADLEIGRTVDIGGVVRSADPKRTFERDDGSEGQVRNVRVQDESGDVRVALWGEKADREIGPGDEIQLADVEITEGWREDLEASAGWRSSVTVVDWGTASTDTVAADRNQDDAETDDDTDGAQATDGDLAAFDGESTNVETGRDAGSDGRENRDDRASENGSSGTEVGSDSGSEPGPTSESEEFTGTVVQAGDPVILDDGERTVSFETGTDVELGQTVTVKGRVHSGEFEPIEIDPHD